MRVLVVDIGGSNIKFQVWKSFDKKKFPTEKSGTAESVLGRVVSETAAWKYDVVSIGFPGRVLHGQPAADPPNLGPGWVHFDYSKCFNKPVKVINDATMQALGSYQGGRMLFLGLGTGLGSTLILDAVVVPLELGELEFGNGRTMAAVLGKDGMQKAGLAAWEAAVHRAANRLTAAFATDYIVLGGGHAKHLKKLPKGTRRGSNENAFVGGARLWGADRPTAHPQKHTWVLA